MVRIGIHDCIEIAGYGSTLVAYLKAKYERTALVFGSYEM